MVPACGAHALPPTLLAGMWCQTELCTGVRVADDTRDINAGEAMAFDDSFEHEAWHDGTETRITLIVDIWHPDLTDRYAACARRRRSTELREAERVSACNIAGR